MPLKSFQPMLRAGDGGWRRFHLQRHDPLATKQRDEARQATRVMWTLPALTRRVGPTMHRLCVARQYRFINLSKRYLLFGKPAAKRVGVSKLTADAFAGIMLRFQVVRKRIQVGADNTVPHPVQDCGLSEVAFDQVLLQPARLAGRKSISGQDYAERFNCGRRAMTGGKAVPTPSLGIIRNSA
jgi:hypothetical protein